MKKFAEKIIELKNRIVVDIDNERQYDTEILGLSQSNNVLNFKGDKITLKEGDYIYLLTENYENGEPDHILAEGYVIKNPYQDLPYRFCCHLQGEIQYLTDLQNATTTHNN